MTVTPQVRAERCGTGEGRTYDINVTCCDDATIDSVTGATTFCGEPGTVDLFVTVPHKQ